MKTYNFDQVIDRTHTNSYKWDVGEQELPMWVADMDFQTAPEVIDAMRKRLENGAFGYSTVPDEWYQAYQDWWEKRHHVQIKKDWMIYCTGAIPAVSTAVRKLTTPAEKVVLLTPVYNIFFNSVVNNGRYVVECPLLYENREYRIDFEELERVFKDPQVSMLIFCNPHNPVGKIWDKETLARLGHLCALYHVIVVSDEVHCDLVEPGLEYTAFASVNEECAQNSISCIAPTKTFNIAGLQTAAVVVPNEQLRHKMWRALNTDEVAEPNAFAVQATVAAFQEGGDWVQALNEYIDENKRFAADFIQENLPGIFVVPGHATYLIWIDCFVLCSQLQMNSEELANDLRTTTGLYLCDGMEYGGNGATFLRMNVACPRSVVEEGLKRLKEYYSKRMS